MSLLLLIAAGLVLAYIATRRLIFRRFLHKWKKMLRDRPMIPIFTSEPIWIPCATDMSDTDDYENDSKNLNKTIKLDLSIVEHHLLWDVYNKINHGCDSVRLSYRLLRGLDIESENNPPLLAVRNWSTHRIERKCILLIQRCKMILNQ